MTFMAGGRLEDVLCVPLLAITTTLIALTLSDIGSSFLSLWICDMNKMEPVERQMFAFVLLLIEQVRQLHSPSSNTSFPDSRCVAHDQIPLYSFDEFSLFLFFLFVNKQGIQTPTLSNLFSVTYLHPFPSSERILV
eukprot:03273_5